MIDVVVGGKKIENGQTFDATFHVTFKQGRLYLIARTDTGMIIMPKAGSKIYADAVKANIVEAKCRLVKTVKTERNTYFAIAEPLEWQVII